MKATKIVQKVEEGMNPEEILCTTYQMRDFYKQLRDGFFSELDVMNYIQHYKAAKLCKKGDRVLDVCCGRMLVLPLLNYHAKDIVEYVGVDICEGNVKNGYIGARTYPFKVRWVWSNVADMDKKLTDNYFDFVIYTSAIEHMQKEAGVKSLENCWKVMKPGAKMFISCPNTEDKKDPYDTQYAAHLYEWDLVELRSELEKNKFRILNTWGLVTKVKEYEGWLTKHPEKVKEYELLREYLPREFLLPYLTILNVEAGVEVGLLVEKIL